MNEPSRSLLLGHRGSPRVKRENTIPSFQAALAAGLDGVELDVQRTLDGVLVLHHDDHLPDGRVIAALRAAEVAAAELPPHPDGSGAASVPTLDEALEWATAAGAYVNVEIKTPGRRSDGREAETARALRRHRARDRVIVSSFDPLVLARVRFEDAGLETGLLFAPNAGRPRWALEGGRSARLLGVRALHPHFTLVTPPLLERARRRGWRVNTWTVNDEHIAARLIENGVHALIGDDPGTLLRAAGRAAPATEGPHAD